jgi:hypothetical protein
MKQSATGTGTGTEKAYHGTELDLFSKALNWKRYWSSRLRPFIQGSVIEVGAALGNSTKYLCQNCQSRWLCLDPDPRFAAYLAKRIAQGDLPPCCEARCGTLADVTAEETADAIVYIDVLEHIERDEDEMRMATAHLQPGGRIIVLSPAFNWLYSPFDKALGHHRRYAPKDARRLTIPQLELQQVFFLDSIGLIASLANRLLLRAAAPSARQIRFWDRVMVTLSTHSDRLLGRMFGRSIVMIWQKSF